MEGDGQKMGNRRGGENSRSPDSLNRQSAVRLRGKACHVTHSTSFSIVSTRPDKFSLHCPLYLGDGNETGIGFLSQAERFFHISALFTALVVC